MITQTELVIRLLLAFALGAGIGIERQWQKARATMRISVLASLGATVFAMTTMLIPGEEISAKTIAPIILGMSLISASIILQKKAKYPTIVTGITTWCAGGIGSLVGLGFFFPAYVSTVAVMLGNLIFQPVELNNTNEELTKQKKIIEEAEDVLLNSANIPMSENILRIIQRRIYDALASMVQLSPSSKELKSRLNEAKQRLGGPIEANNSDSLVLPDNDKQLISLIQGIKKLRAVLRSEHSKGKIESQIFVAEDKRLEKLQLRINVESQIKRGLSARSANMVGSARQYFEKALATLNSVSYSDEYVNSKRQEVEGYLETISSELKASNATSLKKKAEQEQDDLDVLFAPKKKW